MKAFLLAAGKGERLKPLTDKVPKCLLPIRGKPLLQIWLELCEKYGITEVLINLHHLSEQVESFLDRIDSKIKIMRVFEEKLLGSAGAVWTNRDFVRRERDFFIFYTDNLTNINLGRLLSFHKSHNGCLTMGLFRTSNPKDCGIAELDETGKVISFVEKPDTPKSNLANGGIYLANQEIFDFFPSKNFLDFGFDIFPQLTGRMFGYEIEDFLLDIGSIENYSLAQTIWNGIE